MTRYSWLAVLVLGVGCKKDVVDTTDIPNGAKTGPIVVELGSNGADGVNSAVEEVWVTFEDVQLDHTEKGWVSVASERQEVELLGLSTQAVQVGKGDVWEGSYDTLRLLVADSWIVVDGEELDLTITEELQDLVVPGFDFGEDFFVAKDTTTTLMVNWNLGSQLVDDGGAWSLGTGASVDVTLTGE
jgi:hypothetical protein